MLWAFPVVVGVMIYIGYSIEGIKGKVEKPRLPTPLDAVRMLPEKLLYFHGCPNPILDADTMSCVQESKLLPMRMTIRCKVTGDELTTGMIHGIPFDVDQFENVASCPGVSVILWKPAGMAFGVRRGRPREPGTPFSDTLPKIELMSRDPNKIMKLMCGDESKTTSAKDNTKSSHVSTPRAAEAKPPPSTTGAR